MIRSHWLLIQKYNFAILGILAVTACTHTQSLTKDLVHHDDSLEIRTPGAPTMSLQSRWTEGDPQSFRKTTVVMVPGSGVNSVASSAVWQEKLARNGYDVFAYEKRLGTSGPSELAGDLDAACSAVSTHFGQERSAIIWTSEQGTQVVLNSKCLRRSRALVIVSPIPDALDRVWISALKEAGLRDRAESLSATFESIRAGRFEPNAKILGASLAFWKNWLDLAERTPKQFEELTVPILFVIGENDVLLGRYGRHVLEKLVKNRKNRQLIIIPKADRNLFQKEALSRTTVETILSALEVLGKKNAE